MSSSTSPGLTPRRLQVAADLACAIMPPGERVPCDYERTVRSAWSWVCAMHPDVGPWLGRLFDGLDRVARLWTGRRFSALTAERQARLVRQWEQSASMRWPLQTVAFLLKSHHYDHPDYYRALGCVFDRSGRPERARWHQQVVAEDGLEALAGPSRVLECDVVVIGTGAGGAAAGFELAAAGYAVVFLEEGGHAQRDRFSGKSHAAFRTMYRPHMAFGSAPIPVLTGRTVGGSTAINGGTCVRPPRHVLERWARNVGDDGLSATGMGPWFDRVEAVLGVGPTQDAYLGGLGGVIIEGCEALGWRHSRILRNAPECDGQGVCTFGCPTDAKRSTNVSFMPRALERGALLLAQTRAERLLTREGRAVGVTARGVTTGTEVEVRGRAVVLAAGPMRSPSWLLRQGLAAAPDHIGRHLKLHPTTMVSARFDRAIRGYDAVPQAVGCDELRADGLLIYGAAAPPDAGATAVVVNGPRLTALMDAYDQVATMTVIAIDTSSEGRVRLVGGREVTTYRLTHRDVQRLQRGVAHAADIFVAAGAEEIYPLCLPHPAFPAADLGRFRRASLGPRDFVLTSVHPLGTNRMADSPRRGVVGPDHQVFGTPGLYVVDASTLPTTPRVNPQLVTMALGARAGAHLADRLGR